MEHSAKSALVAHNKEFPEVGKLVEMLAFGDEKRRKEWPDDILLPRKIWPAICMQVMGITTDEYFARRDVLVNRAVRMKFLSTWAKTQGIYRFDNTVYQELLEAPFSGDIPAAVLRQLPEWAIYIETPGIDLMPGHPCKGCWVMIDFETDAPTGEYELNIMFDVKSPPLKSGPLAVTFGVPLAGGSIESVMDEYRKSSLKAYDLGGFGLDVKTNPSEVNEVLGDLSVVAGKVMSLVLFICTQQDYAAGQTPSRPMPVKTKRGMRVFDPATPKTWDVGVRMGSAIRAATAEAERAGGPGSGGSVRPHMRRQHWHGFRVGKRKDESGAPIAPEKRDLVVRFIPSIPVNMPEGMLPDDLPAVIRKVGPSGNESGPVR